MIIPPIGSDFAKSQDLSVIISVIIRFMEDHAEYLAEIEEAC